MIELLKRQSVSERRQPVIVIDIFNDDIKASEYINNVLGSETYEKICDVINDNIRRANELRYNFLIIYEQTKEYRLVYSWSDVLDKCRNFSMFDENDKSSFPYWFAHWCSFQLCALNLGVWKFKYLFHDCEKPWLRLIWPYKKVQKWHRTHNSHHLEYGLKHGFDKIDWKALMIDWECSQMSKKQCPLNCREEMENKLSEEKWQPYKKEIRTYLEPLLDSYML